MGDAPGSEGQVVRAFFRDADSAQAAIRDLRAAGVPAEDISLISRSEGRPWEPDIAEDLAADRTYTMDRGTQDQDLPIVTSFEVPPDEPLGGSERLGLDHDDNHVRSIEERQSMVSVRIRPGSLDAVMRVLVAHGGESIH